MTKKYEIDDLRNHLFETMAALRDPVKPMEVERANAVVKVAQAIIGTAKVEVDYMKNVGGKGSGFIPEAPKLPAPEKKSNGNGQHADQ